MKSLKLDFNERADSVPDWLNSAQFNTAELWKYPNKTELQAKIAKQFAINEDQVFISNGGDESIELLFKLCKLNNKSILLPLPGFSQYTHNIRVWGIDYQTLNANNDLSIDTNAIIKSLKSNQWLILTRPNNPTGECIDEKSLIEILEAAKSQGANVFLDEAYIEFFQDFENRLYAQEFDNVVCLRTFSKAFGLAGTRVGYLLGNVELINSFKAIAMPFNVNRLSLELAAQALDNQDEVKSYCQKINQNRIQLFQLLQQAKIEVFEGKGNFLLFKLKPKLKTLFCNYLSKNNIKVKSQMQGLEGCVRITIPENIDTLMQAIKTILSPAILAFDMDGVLIDTTNSYDACIQKTVETMTQQQVSLQEINNLREQGGFNNDWDLSLALVQEKGFEVEFKDVKKIFQSLYLGENGNAGLVENEEKLLDINTWNQLDTRKAIVTGRPKQEAISGADKLNINPDMIVSADDVSQQKPSPAGLLSVQKQLKSSSMWFFGDTVDDMQAGTQAECVCIGIGKNSENLYQAGADLVIENINQVTQIYSNKQVKS